MKKIAHDNNGRNVEAEDLAQKIAPLLTQILLVVLAPKADRDNDLVPLAEAARIAATSPRVVLDAIRAGELPGFGRQRDRSVRRADLTSWIESRKIVHSPIDDRDLEKRMARLSRVA